MICFLFYIILHIQIFTHCKLECPGFCGPKQQILQQTFLNFANFAVDFANFAKWHKFGNYQRKIPNLEIVNP